MAQPKSETYLYEDMEAVRQSGLTNMIDRHGVIEVARMLDLDQLADHLEIIGRPGFGTFLRNYSKFLTGETS